MRVVLGSIQRARHACPIRLDGVREENQVKHVPHEHIQMLGVPLGDGAFVSKFVEGKLLDRLQETVNRLVEFEDTQAATYLLRVSYSIVRAVHFMRTTPLEQWKEQAVKFDSMIRSAIESILADPMSDETYAQACLTPRLGGLGLRKVFEHAGLAYHATGMKRRRLREKCGCRLLVCLRSICRRKTPPLSLTIRCTLI